MPLLNASRRRLLRSGAAVIAASAALPMARAQAARGSSRNPVVAQIVDVSLQQQDVSKDFLIGSRAAWQDINVFVTDEAPEDGLEQAIAKSGVKLIVANGA